MSSYYNNISHSGHVDRKTTLGVVFLLLRLLMSGMPFGPSTKLGTGKIRTTLPLIF